MKKIYNLLRNWNLLTLYTCQLLVVDTTAEKGSKSQVRTLYVKTTNAIFIHINNKRVKLNSIYTVSPLKNDTYITIKIRGIFNSKTKKIIVPNLNVEIIQRQFSNTKKQNEEPLIKKEATLNKMREIRLSRNILVKKNNNQLSFSKILKLKSNNQTLETFNNN